METLKKDTNVFLVLVPHREIRAALRKFCETLEIKGVYPFPWVTPLAVLSKPLKADELKQIAASLRKKTEKFNTKEPKVITFSVDETDFSLLGPELDFEIEPEITNNSMRTIEKPVLGMYLIPKNNTKLQNKILDSIKNFSKLSFRAAAAANMYFYRNTKDSYVWKIDKLHWLPKVK